MKLDDCKALWQTLVSINFSDDDSKVKDFKKFKTFSD